MGQKYFQYFRGKLPLPVFFPDATRAVVRTVDTQDIEATKTPGILVNTYHLYNELGKKVLKKFGGIRGFMGWQGAVISDSGGFQVMSIAKQQSKQGGVSDMGVVFKQTKKKKLLLTPEKSIQFQMLLKPDMVVVLDDFTMPKASYKQAKETVDRTVLWAKRCKDEFEKICQASRLKEDDRPYICAVIQGGEYLDLRKECAERLVNIGFDAYGYGGWPIKESGEFNFDVAKRIVKDVPKDCFVYGLGIGKPEEIVVCASMGFDIFDCVLPTRDGRHGRLYVYKAESIDKIDVFEPNFYYFLTPDKQKFYSDDSPISQACDCLLCQHYSRAYLGHLFRVGDMTAQRLATIHNLRFYSILMEKLQQG